jgi:LysR family transcriptional regulator, regulator of abg operon
VVLECESFTTLLALMPGADVVGIMPEPFYRAHAASHGIVSMPIEEPLPRVTLHAVWRAEVPLTAPAAHLLDAMEAESRSLRARH